MPNTRRGKIKPKHKIKVKNNAAVDKAVQRQQAKASRRAKRSTGKAQAEEPAKISRTKVRALVESLNARAAKYTPRGLNKVEVGEYREGTEAQAEAAAASGELRKGTKHYAKRTTAQTEHGRAWHRAVNDPETGQQLRDHDALRKFLRNNPDKDVSDWKKMRRDRARARAKREREAA